MKSVFIRRVVIVFALPGLFLGQFCTGNAAALDRGMVLAWGASGSSQTNPPPGLSNVVGIAAGGYHSLAVKDDGNVAAWGANSSGQTNIPPGLTNIVSVAAGGYFSLALKKDGSVVGWGENGLGQIAVPAAATGVVAIASGWNQSLALRSDGTVVGWGQNNHGQASPPVGLTNVVGIAAGEAHSIALDRDGNVVSWGMGGTVFRIQTNVAAISANGYHSIALKRDGTVVEWGGNANTVPNSATGLAAVAAGYFHSLGLRSNGTVIGWGAGAGTVPTGLSNVAAIAAGYSHSVAVGGALDLPSQRILVNAIPFAGGLAKVRGSATVSLVMVPGDGIALYSLDGSDPRVSGILYSSPFMVTKAALLRFVVYSQDFSSYALLEPVQIVVLPQLAVKTDGGGNVSIYPADGPYLADSIAVVEATPSPGWLFLRWLGDAEGTNSVINVSMTRDKSVQAVFGTSMGLTTIGSGALALNPSSTLYPFGSVVRLSAIPHPGSYFVSWGGAAGGSNNPLGFPITTANPSVTAVFSLLGGIQDYSLTVIPEGGGDVSVTPSGNRFPRLTNVIIQASPKAGQSFIGWSGASVGANNPLEVTMNSNKVIRALFTKRPRLFVEHGAELLDGGGVRINIEGEWGQICRIDGTTNLNEWTSLTTLTNLFGLSQFTDYSPTNASIKFYRAVVP